MAVRIASAVVRYVLTEFNETGEPINEFLSQECRVFRVVHPDIWAHGDALAFPPKDQPQPDRVTFIAEKASE